MKLIIKEQNPEAGSAGDLIAVIEDWAGPIPREGDAIVHPPLDPSDTERQTFPWCSVMTVKSSRPLWNIITRPGRERGAPRHFVGHPEPSVEIWV